ncbi:MAG: DUF3892 domain-containing protein [Alphaproteobacteria bacterium]|nr:DUF3892 domain-containing protein [Alphaproteobacteria bacterium]
MAVTREIKCVNKTDRYDPHERILAVGGQLPDGSQWKMPQQDVVRAIESGQMGFIVSVKGQTVKVIVATSRYGNKYIKTESDGEQPNNLLSLYECR